MTTNQRNRTPEPSRALLLLVTAVAATFGSATTTASSTDESRSSTFDVPVLREAYGSARDLEKAIERYQRIERRGGFETLDSGVVLQFGDAGPEVETLRRRLSQEGYDIASTGERFDAEVEEAVRALQTRNGLLVDGKVGPETLAALRVAAAERVRTLQQNLERRRDALRPGMAERAIVVNVAEQVLRAWDGRRDIEMKVIVGSPDWATPRIEETLEYVVVNPYWTVPIEIIAAELKDEIAADLSVLDQKNMKVFRELGPNAEPVNPAEVDWSAIRAEDPDSFPFYLRRLPGPENPLGRIKFMMPNREDIYLHDTPHDEAFDEHERALSHGCIRLEEPLELASLVASLTPWSSKQFREAVATGGFETVSLETPMPVELVYWTAWVDGDGDVHFRDDIYGLDGG